MKFSFLCKQGQSELVCWVLREEHGLHPRVSLYDGERGRGVMVECEHNLSNRAIDRSLYDLGIPGAVSRKNKYRVFNADKAVLGLSQIRYSFESGDEFILVYNGKMMRANYRSYVRCECCGPEHYLLVKKNGKWEEWVI